MLYPYDKTYDRITTRTSKPLEILDRVKYNPTTSEDPVILKVLHCIFICINQPYVYISFSLRTKTRPQFM